jgi:uncharacterized protein YggE
LTIKLRTIQDAGKIIDDLTAINGLLINGGTYETENDRATLEIARTLAFENAKQKAEALAKLSNMDLGKPMSISETVYDNTIVPSYRTMALDESRESSAVTTINPGEQEKTIQLNIVFEME